MRSGHETAAREAPRDEEEVRPGATAVAPAPGRSLEVTDFGDDAGAGLEGVDTSQLIVPFLSVLQKGSPQCDEAQPEAYLPQAKPGMFYDTAMGELLDGKRGVDGIVCAVDSHYGIWLPRDRGGGFRGMLGMRDPAVIELIQRCKSKFNLPRYRQGQWSKPPFLHEGEEVELVETIQFYLLYAPADELDEAMARQAIASYSSTRLAPAAAAITRMNSWVYRQNDNSMRPAATYSYRWRFTTIPQQNAQGSWHNWKIDLLPLGAKPREALLDRTSPLFARAKAFYQQYKSGQLKPDYAAAAGEGAGNDDPPF